MGITRRGLLLSGAAVGGGLLLGVAGVAAHLSTHDRLSHQRKSQSGAQGESLNLWIRVTTDNEVVLLVPHTEMGQGSQTGLGQIVAEELDIDWSQLRIELAPAETAFANGAALEPFVREAVSPPEWATKMFQNGLHRMADMMSLQLTGGSTAIRGTGWLSMRSAAAAGRLMLLEAAAREWNVDVASLSTASGFVVNEATGQKVPYSDLVAAAAEQDIPTEITFKDPAQYKIVGQSIQRIDIESKVNAQADYGIDASVPEMKFASVVPIGAFGAELDTIENSEEVTKRRGIVGVYPVEHGIAVIADNPWRAEQAVRALRFSAKPHANDTASSASLEEEQRTALSGKLDTHFEQGNVSLAIADSGNQVTAEYFVPYLAHATMEPMNATVWQQDGKMHVKCGVQNPLASRKKVAKIAGVKIEDVVLHPCTMGGGFGRRVGLGVNGDPLIWLQQAVLLHQESNQAVKMTWSREMDMRTDVYRPMVLAQFRAGLENDGTPKFWDSRHFLSSQDVAAPVPPYAIEHIAVRHAGDNQFVPTGFWRSVDASQHSFFVESFIDELALAAGEDPLAYRLKLLDDNATHAKALRAVATMAGWRSGVSEQGRAMGVAVVHSFGTTVAQIAEVSLEPSGSPKVHNVWAAVDCGLPINPASIEAQVAGSIHFGLSAALYGKCDIKDGAVVQSNYHDYRLVKLADAPAVKVQVMSSDNPIGGIGEVGVPPIAPAVCNALAVLGERSRRLPVVA